MSLGALESIARSLETIAGSLGSVDSLINTTQTQSAEPDNTSDSTPAAAKKTAAKKTAAKKTAAKKTAAKKPKGPDLSDMTVFKKSLFEIAESSGVSDVMPKLKAYIASCDYGSSDEVEVDDRAQFLKDVEAHFSELASDGDDDTDDDEDDDELAGL